MTRSTNMEHVAHLQRMANESWIGSPERAALDAAIASLSAPQPPAEAQPNWKEAPPGATHYQLHQDAYYKRVSASEWYVWSREDDRGLMRWLLSPSTSDSAEWVVRPSEAQPCGCGEASCAVPWEPGCGLGKSEQHAEAQAQVGGGVVAWWNPDAEFSDPFSQSQTRKHRIALYAAPPSAPVGVEKMRAEDAPALPGSWALADAYAAGWNDALSQQPAAFNTAAAPTHAQGSVEQQPAADDVDAEWFRKGWQAGFAEGQLYQQPAAVDGAMVERALDAVFPPTFKRNDALREMWRKGLTAALSQQGGES